MTTTSMHDASNELITKYLANKTTAIVLSQREKTIIGWALVNLSFAIVEGEEIINASATEVNDIMVKVVK